MTLRLRVHKLDLDLTLYPSFVLALMEPLNNGYVKVVGRGKGCKIRVEGRYLVTDCGEEEALYWSGAWFQEKLDPGLVRRSYRWLVEALLETYERLGLAVNPLEPLLMFIPIFLSQNTSYHTNVLRWCRSLWRISSDPLEISRRAADVGRSYQLARLGSAVLCAASAIGRDYWRVRQKLISCKWVGPKVADAFLLFGLAVTNSVPVDKHFTRMVGRLGLWPDATPPRKDLCARYKCPECPLAAKCLRRLASEALGPLAGWVQTAFYLHDKLYCSAQRCSECVLRPECRNQGLAP